MKAKRQKIREARQFGRAECGRSTYASLSYTDFVKVRHAALFMVAARVSA
jgi:hypothetical protein